MLAVKVSGCNILRHLPASSDRLRPTASACVSFPQRWLLCGGAYYPPVVWPRLRLPPSSCTMTPFRTFCSYGGEGTSQIHLILRFLKASDEVTYLPPSSPSFLIIVKLPKTNQFALTSCSSWRTAGSIIRIWHASQESEQLERAELLGSPAPHFRQRPFWSVHQSSGLCKSLSVPPQGKFAKPGSGDAMERAQGFRIGKIPA